MSRNRAKGSQERFGPYSVYEYLGVGGMATVHRASLELENGDRCDVALKRLLPTLANDPIAVASFVREAKLAARLQHPKIVRVLEIGRVRGTHYIALELVRGVSLNTWMSRVRALGELVPIACALSLVGELCDALAYTHDSHDEHGSPLHIVHRDISPSNLLVTSDGHLKLIDFGVAKAEGPFATSSGVVKGKLGYMSLEALVGDNVDARTDIFSAGVVLWELLAGRKLVDADSDVAMIDQIRAGARERPSESRADCSQELDRIVMRAIARRRRDRWPSATALGDALRELDIPASSQDVAGWIRSLGDAPREPEIAPETENTSTALAFEDLIELAPDEVLVHAWERLGTSNEDAEFVVEEPVPFAPKRY